MSPRGVFAAQLAMLGAFYCFACAVIAWIVYRAYDTTVIRDAGGATIAIAFIIVPIFLILFGVVSIVFLGILRDRSKQ